MLVRQFENDWMSVLDPWLPCFANHGWCEDISDRLPTTIVNDKARKLFYEIKGGGGFVLEPSIVQIYCAYPEDGNVRKQDSNPVPVWSLLLSLLTARVCLRSCSCRAWVTGATHRVAMASPASLAATTWRAMPRSHAKLEL